MENYKDLYEIEKRQRLNVERTMKEIVNGLCLSAYTIAEDSKMQMLKNDLQRIQQEIVRLEATKQERLQQHLMSVGGMIQQMTGSSVGMISTAQANSFAANQQRGGLSMLPSIASQSHSTPATVTQPPTQPNGGTFTKPRAQPRPRRKRNADEVPVRPKSAVPPKNAVNGPTAMPQELLKRPCSAVPPPIIPPAVPPVTQPAVSPVVAEPASVLETTNSDEHNKEQPIVKPSTPIEPLGKLIIDESEQESELKDKSQSEDDISMTETINGTGNTAEKKDKYFCEYCETAAVDEPSTIAHVWGHVNEIRRTHAFECVVADCLFKSNVTKEALAHKKNAHVAEDECKILDRRDTLAEYFKHCINKYFIHLDDAAKDRVFEARHS